MNSALTIRTHDELIAYVPHALGFKRVEQSMVCLALGGGPTARVDLPGPGDLEPFLHQLSEVYLVRHPTRRVALLAFGEDRPSCLQALSALGDTLANGNGGPDVGPMLWVNGDEWFDVLERTRGTVDSATRTRIAAEFALRGTVMPVGSREDLATAMQGDPGPVAEHLPAAHQRVTAMDPSGRTSEVEWLRSRLDEFLQDTRPMSDRDAARMLAVIRDNGALSAAATRMSRANAHVFSELWHDLVRRAPEEVRNTPAALLALSSYLEGKGAHAWVALDQITTANPPLADAVATALEQAIDPRQWEQAISRAMRQAASGALIQHAALHDAAGPKRRAPDQAAAPNGHGVDGPESSALGR